MRKDKAKNSTVNVNLSKKVEGSFNINIGSFNLFFLF